MDFHLRQAACVDVRGKITTKVCRNRERYHLISCHLSSAFLKAVSPWVHQASVLNAISSISLKLGQFKGCTPKLKMTNWFVVWIFMVGDSPPNWFNYIFYQIIIIIIITNIYTG